MNDLTDITFDDDSRPVPVQQFCLPEPDESTVEGVLLEHGMPGREIQAAAERLNELAQAYAIKFAAGHLRQILSALEGFPEAVPLLRVLSGSKGVSLRKAAKQSKVSHSTLFTRERAIRARLKKNTSRLL